MIRSLDLLYFRQKSLIKNIELSNIELEGLELIFSKERIIFLCFLDLRGEASYIEMSEVTGSSKQLHGCNTF